MKKSPHEKLDSQAVLSACTQPMARFVQELIALQIALTKPKTSCCSCSWRGTTGRPGRVSKALVPLLPGNIHFDPISPRAAAWTQLHRVQEDAHGAGSIIYTQLAVRRVEAAWKMRVWRNRCLLRSCHQFYFPFPLDLLVRKHKTKEADGKQAVTPTGQPSSGERRYSAVGLRTAWLASMLPTVPLLPVSPLLGPPRRVAKTPAVPPACGAASPSPSPAVTVSPVRAEPGLSVSGGGCR